MLKTCDYYFFQQRRCTTATKKSCGFNILNRNDRRSIMNTKDVFSGDGNFKVSDDGEEIGKDLLMRKATGYVVRQGRESIHIPIQNLANRVLPENTYNSIPKPTIQLNGKPISQPIEMLSVYPQVGDVQQASYNYIIERLKQGAGQDPIGICHLSKIWRL